MSWTTSRGRSAGACLLALGLALAACDDGEPPTDAGPAPSAAPTATFAPSDGPMTFGDAPFPSDLFLGADGTVDLAAPPSGATPWPAVMPDLDRLDGFCRSCSLTFPVDGSLDGALPEGSVILAPLDDPSARVPLDLETNGVDGAVIVRPSRGHVLAPLTAYVAVLRDVVLAPDGAPVAPSEDFLFVRDGVGDATPARTRAATIIGPGLDALESAGVDRASIVSATVFTTRDTGSHLTALRQLADAAATPIATADTVWSADDGSLDALLGTPSEPRPGYRVPTTDADGTRAMWHASITRLVGGAFEAPRVIEGEGAELGLLRRAADGAPIAGPIAEGIPYVLAIPTGADVTSLPVCFVLPGVAATRKDALLMANTLAAAGIATISIDLFGLGSRAATSRDEQHDFRGGDLGPDGFFEHDDAQVAESLLGTAGVPAGTELHPGYLHANASQWIVEGLATLRLLAEGDVTAIAASDPALAGLAFDPDAVFVAGMSTGGFLAPALLAVADDVAAASLSLIPGRFLDSYCEGADNRGIFELVLTGGLGLRGRFDEVERRLCMNPLLNLYVWLIEDVTAPVALHHLLDEPLRPGARPDLLFQFGGLDERLGQPGASDLLAIADVPGVGDYPFATVAPATPPVSANRVTPNGTITAAGWLFPDASHHLLSWANDRSNVVPPAAPPFVMRDDTLDVTNPIAQAHGQIRSFFESRLRTGRAEMTAP